MPIAIAVMPILSSVERIDFLAQSDDVRSFKWLASHAPGLAFCDVKLVNRREFSFGYVSRHTYTLRRPPKGRKVRFAITVTSSASAGGVAAMRRPTSCTPEDPRRE